MGPLPFNPSRFKPDMIPGSAGCGSSALRGGLGEPRLDRRRACAAGCPRLTSGRGRCRGGDRRGKVAPRRGDSRMRTPLPRGRRPRRDPQRATAGRGVAANAIQAASSRPSANTERRRRMPKSPLCRSDIWRGCGDGRAQHAPGPRLRHRAGGANPRTRDWRNLTVAGGVEQPTTSRSTSSPYPSSAVPCQTLITIDTSSPRHRHNARAASPQRRDNEPYRRAPRRSTASWHAEGERAVERARVVARNIRGRCRNPYRVR